MHTPDHFTQTSVFNQTSVTVYTTNFLGLKKAVFRIAGITEDIGVIRQRPLEPLYHFIRRAGTYFHEIYEYRNRQVEINTEIAKSIHSRVR